MIIDGQYINAHINIVLHKVTVYVCDAFPILDHVLRMPKVCFVCQ